MPMKLLIIVGGVVLVMIVISIAGTLYFTGFFSGHTAAVPVAPHPVEIDYSTAPPNYIHIKPTFIINALEGDKLHHLMTDVTVMARNPKAISAVQSNLLGVRNSILEALSGHGFREIIGQEGIERLRTNIKESLNQFLEHKHAPHIDVIYFTSFMVQ